MTATKVVLPELKWERSPNQSDRLHGPVDLVVVHRPVGSYTGSIRALLNDSRPPAERVSAHAIVRDDGAEATQLVGWDRKAWACAAFNAVSDNIETPDLIWTAAALTPELALVMQICARVVAFRLHKRNLPPSYVTAGELARGRGFTRHVDLGRPGGGHSDPTTDPRRWAMFCELVRREAARGGFRAVWGRGDAAAAV